MHACKVVVAFLADGVKDMAPLDEGQHAVAHLAVLITNGFSLRTTTRIALPPVFSPRETLPNMW
jgi:hypothetical protein